MPRGTSYAAPVTLKLAKFRDERGWFLPLTQTRAQHAIGFDWITENVSFSHRGVLRGLHYQRFGAQAKLVTVLMGEIFDVAVDVREKSPSFGKVWHFHLAEADNQQLLLPPGFAHGFYTLSESALIHYKADQYWNPESDVTIRWDDPHLNIPWPLVGNPILSAKDSDGLCWHDLTPAHLPQ